MRRKKKYIREPPFYSRSPQDILYLDGDNMISTIYCPLQKFLFVYDLYS
jgi:hypothetical protein